MSSVFRCFICRNCTAAAAPRLHFRQSARSATTRIHTRLQPHHLCISLFSTALLPRQQCLHTRSITQATLASTRCTTRRLGSMAGNAVAQDTESQQALRPLPANGQGFSTGLASTTVQLPAGSKKRSRDEQETALPAESNRHASSAANGSVDAPTSTVAENGSNQPPMQSLAQDPTSSNIEGIVQQAADLLEADPGLLPSRSSKDNGSEILQQAGAEIKPKQARGKRTKPAATQPDASDQQAVSQQPEANTTIGKPKSKRAKVAQAVAAAKVMVEQEHTEQDPAIANAPLTEDHPVHRVSKKAAPPVVQAKPADAAPRISENFHDTAAPEGALGPQDTANSLSAASTAARGRQRAPRRAAAAVPTASQVAELPQQHSAAPGTTAASKPRTRAGRKTAVAGVKEEPALPELSTGPAAAEPAEPAMPAKPAVPGTSAISEAAAEVSAEPALPKAKQGRGKKAAAIDVKSEPSASELSEDAAPAQPAAPKPRRSRAKKPAAVAVKEEPSSSEMSDTAAEAAPRPAVPKPRAGRGKKAAAPPLKQEESASKVSAAPGAVSEVPATAAASSKKPARSRKKAAVKVEPSTSEGDAKLPAGDATEAAVKKKPARSRKKAASAAVKEEPSMSETSEEEVQVTGQDSVKKVAKPRRRKFDNELTVRLLAAAKAALAAPETVVIPPRPVPNLGYACLNSTLQLQKPPVTTNRGAILRTFEEKGLPHISQLALQNCKDLLPIIQWNHEHNIRLFRLSSDLFPWGDSGKYQLNELPDLPEIKEVLAEAGQLARLYQQRLTAHPSEFCKMAAPREEVLEKSILALEVHAKVFDMLGYEPNHWNKVNIHIGGTYDDKEATLQRFADNFQKLSPNVQKRLAVENDDKATQWSITDLLPLHKKIGVPLTFDFHHHRFCTGGLTHEEAFKAAIATWPKGIRPQVHWSEEPEDPEKVRRAHSKYIRGPMNLYGLEADVDVMIEAKSKEMTLLDFRQYAEHDIQLPGAADDHDRKIYERIVKEKEDLEQLKGKAQEMEKLQAAAAPFL